MEKVCPMENLIILLLALTILVNGMTACTPGRESPGPSPEAPAILILPDLRLQPVLFDVPNLAKAQWH